jgi:hypothetical protein
MNVIYTNSYICKFSNVFLKNARIYLPNCNCEVPFIGQKRSTMKKLFANVCFAGQFKRILNTKTDFFLTKSMKSTTVYLRKA